MSALRRIAAVLFRAVADELDPTTEVEAVPGETRSVPFAPDLMTWVN